VALHLARVVPRCCKILASKAAPAIGWDERQCGYTVLASTNARPGDQLGVRVVHVYKDIFPPVVGGIERHIDTIRRSLPEIDCDVVVCARGWRTKKRNTGHGAEVLVGELGRILSVPIAPTFPLWLARQHPDIVHLHMPNPTGELSVLLAVRATPLVVTYHADIDRQAIFNPIYQPLVQACLRRASSILVTSPRMLESSTALAPYAHKVESVPFAVDLARFDPARITESERQCVSRRFGSPLIVSVGRLVYYKGFEQLIEASRELDASVIIVGGGPLESQLRTLARDLPRMHIVGEASEEELVAYLAAADCFVLASTSRAEGFGIATLEAQAMGVPAVVTDVGTATVEAIDPGRSGLVIRPRSPKEIVAACREVIENPDRRRTMSVAARRHVLAHHSPAALATRLRAVYARALSEPDLA
jgi:glycosyltransferase involved in cell wall biosynthesis